MIRDTGANWPIYETLIKNPLSNDFLYTNICGISSMLTGTVSLEIEDPRVALVDGNVQFSVMRSQNWEVFEEALRFNMVHVADHGAELVTHAWYHLDSSQQLILSEYGLWEDGSVDKAHLLNGGVANWGEPEREVFAPYYAVLPHLTDALASYAGPPQIDPRMADEPDFVWFHSNQIAE